MHTRWSYLNQPTTLPPPPLSQSCNLPPHVRINIELCVFTNMYSKLRVSHRSSSSSSQTVIWLLGGPAKFQSNFFLPKPDGLFILWCIDSNSWSTGVNTARIHQQETNTKRAHTWRYRYIASMSVHCTSYQPDACYAGWCWLNSTQIHTHSKWYRCLFYWNWKLPKKHMYEHISLENIVSHRFSYRPCDAYHIYAVSCRVVWCRFASLVDCFHSPALSAWKQHGNSVAISGQNFSDAAECELTRKIRRIKQHRMANSFRLMPNRRFGSFAHETWNEIRAMRTFVNANASRSRFHWA